MTHATFLFADLAGFTALTERVGDEAAADLALRFCDEVCALNSGHGAEDVKTLGDGALIRVGDPTLAICLALDIVGQVGARNGLPAVRVGGHHGPAVRRRGDWYGSTINIAARIAALAEPGQALFSAQARAAAGPDDAVRFTHLGRRPLRGVSTAVELLAAARTAH